MSGIHRRNPEKFYPEHEKQVRSEIHGQNGELIFLDKHPIEIVLAVNAYPKMKEALKELGAVQDALEFGEDPRKIIKMIQDIRAKAGSL